jgi:BlaI family transcriptional regulator, penicillinase repressor
MTQLMNNAVTPQLTPGEGQANIVEDKLPPASRGRRSESRMGADYYSSENSMKFPRLTRCELELMDVLWQKGEATVQEVCDQLTRPLAYTTVMTTLGLLHSKKKVLKRVKRGRAHVYQPLISRDEVSRAVLSDLRDVLFADQVPLLVLGLLEDGKFSQADVEALKAAIRKVETDGEA